MTVFTNIAVYKFTPLTNLKPLREHLTAQCKAWGLKGTILLSVEGINLFVSGLRPEIELLLIALQSIPGLEGLTPKFSESQDQPFSRMLVRIKKEIITFGVDSIQPAHYTSPKISPPQLKQWLDEGRPVTLLDTRNEYEVKLGTFKGAQDLGLDHFREFPVAVQHLSPALKDQTLVVFCTGGIRCEKAAPFLEQSGFRQVYQLDGGILKYFEECGSAHYEGECYVFDKRVGVDPSLQETHSTQCFVCLTPLTLEDQADARYLESVSCPYCFQTTQQQQQAVLVQRHLAISQATTPLPGSQPYDNYRPIMVPPACEGMTLVDCLGTIFSHIPASQWLSLCAQDRLLNHELQPVTTTQPVRAGERYLHLFPGIVEPEVNPDIRILYEDEALILLDKPAPLPLHPSGRFNRNTLQAILKRVYHPQKPHPVHRLDANTTGLMVWARTRHFAGLLQPQFEQGLIEKVYLVRVQGYPPTDIFSCQAPISAEPGALGSRTILEEGLPAHTEFQVLDRYTDGTALLKAFPITGRTHQIRVHLWHLGWPVYGDPLYLAEHTLGTTQTLPCLAPPLCLHSWQMSFIHPLTRERVRHETVLPRWML